MITTQDFMKALNLVELSPSTRKEMDITTADLNRPGMQFCGYYEFFAYERPQMIGKQEMSYLEAMSPQIRQERL